jgi:acetyltransferase-like isoleucine patch superfamily enzyme
MNKRSAETGIFIDRTAVIHDLVSLQASTRGTKIIVGANSQIDAFVKIRPTGGPGDVVIGQRTYINSCTVIYSGNGVTIGDDVLIGPNVSMVPINHSFLCSDVTIKSQGYSPSKGGIKIGNDVWIGAGCTILDGAEIGEGSVIGANSLVIGKIEPYTVNYGIPTRPTGVRRTPGKRRDNLV